MVALGLGMVLDNRFDELRHLGGEPHFSALGTDQGGDIFKFVELIAPSLLVGDCFWPQSVRRIEGNYWVGS